MHAGQAALEQHQRVELDAAQLGAHGTFHILHGCGQCLAAERVVVVTGGGSARELVEGARDGADGRGVDDGRNGAGGSRVSVG